MFIHPIILTMQCIVIMETPAIKLKHGANMIYAKMGGILSSIVLIIKTSHGLSGVDKVSRQKYK